MKNKKIFYSVVISSILLYIIIGGIFFYSYMFDFSLANISFWLLLPGLLIMKDVILYSNCGTIYYTSFDRGKVKKNTSPFYRMFLLIREYVLPGLLIMYLFMIMVDVFGLHIISNQERFLGLNRNFIFFILCVFGIGSLLINTDKVKDYMTYKKYSRSNTIIYLLLVVSVSFGSGYILFSQFTKISLLSVSIIYCMMFLLFFFGLAISHEKTSTYLSS